MRNQGLPHEPIRRAIFWVLAFTWPAFMVAFDAWPMKCETGDAFKIAGSILSGVTGTAFLLGRALYLNTQAQVCERLDDMERCWQVTHPDPRPDLQVIPNDG